MSFGESSQNFYSTSHPVGYPVGFVKAGFSIFCKVTSFKAANKTGLTDFPEKRAPTKVKHLLPVCKVSRARVRLLELSSSARVRS